MIPCKFGCHRSLSRNCVRLQQGDYDRDTVFSQDPGATARRWFQEGASCLHCVDLDGARSGSIINETAIRAIVQAAEGRPVQLGGGIRNEATIERLLALGVIAIGGGDSGSQRSGVVRRICERFRGIWSWDWMLADGMVATEGWLETSTTRAVDLVARIAQETVDCGRRGLHRYRA